MYNPTKPPSHPSARPYSVNVTVRPRPKRSAITIPFFTLCFESARGTMINTRGKVHGSTIIDIPAKNAKENPGTIVGEVSKLNPPTSMIDKRMNAIPTSAIFTLSMRILFVTQHSLLHFL